MILSSLCQAYVPTPVSTQPTTTINAIMYGYNPTQTKSIPLVINSDGSINAKLIFAPTVDPTFTNSWTPCGTNTVTPTPTITLTPMYPMAVINPAPSQTVTPLVVDCPSCPGGAGSGSVSVYVNANPTPGTTPTWIPYSPGGYVGSGGSGGGGGVYPTTTFVVVVSGGVSLLGGSVSISGGSVSVAGGSINATIVFPSVQLVSFGSPTSTPSITPTGSATPTYSATPLYEVNVNNWLFNSSPTPQYPVSVTNWLFNASPTPQYPVSVVNLTPQIIPTFQYVILPTATNTFTPTPTFTFTPTGSPAFTPTATNLIGVNVNNWMFNSSPTPQYPVSVVNQFIGGVYPTATLAVVISNWTFNSSPTPQYPVSVTNWNFSSSPTPQYPVSVVNVAGVSITNNPHVDANNNQIFSANSVLGDLVTSERFNQVEVNFSGGFANVNNQITSMVSGNGTTAVTNGEMILGTGTGAGEAAVSTVGSLEYRPGHEWYAYFTGAFPVTATNSYSRIGAYNGTDGFWVGYESGASAVTFGITKVQGGVTTFTAQSAWNGDVCTGQVGSKFTSGGAPVSLNQAFLNIYRVHGAWFGASPVLVDIFSPDGAWINVENFRFPNTQLAPFMSTTTLNMKADVNKTSGAGSVTLASACWAMGTLDSTQTLSDINFDYNSGQIMKAYIGGRLANGQYQISGLVQAGTPVPAGMNSVPVELPQNSLNLSSFTEAPTAFSSGYTSLIAASGAKIIYVYQWDMTSNGAATIYFSNSASNQLSESGVCLFGEQTGPTGGVCFKGVAGGDIGINCSAACTVSLHLGYLQQ